MELGNNPDTKAIHDMFERLAGRYDLFNHLSCLGLDLLWRQKTLRPVSGGMNVLDLGCGTGDLTLGAAKRLGGGGRVTGIDFSEGMLKIAKKRLGEMKPQLSNKVRFLSCRAEDLPIEDTPYDVVLSGFVLRNIYENIDAILSRVHRSMKRGGRISFLDLTEPSNPLVRRLWFFYMHGCVDLYGRLLFGADYPDFYLTQSAARFPKKEEFVKKLKEEGFTDISAKNLFLGFIVLYGASKE